MYYVEIFLLHMTGNLMGDISSINIDYPYFNYNIRGKGNKNTVSSDFTGSNFSLTCIKRVDKGV